MEEKLEILYKECIDELRSIKIELTPEIVGQIDIKIAPRKTKRYGCCRQEEPDERYYKMIRQGRRLIKKYERYKVHHIEISKWLMELDEGIIKNTIIHELIHCFPGCNDHGTTFKKYAKYINQKLGYSISRLGNKEEDYKKSNLEFEEKEDYKYKIVCQKCGQEIYRKRLNKKLLSKYRCGLCHGKLKLEE